MRLILEEPGENIKTENQNKSIEIGIKTSQKLQNCPI